MDILLFPFNEYYWFYLAFTGFVLTMLLLDLGVFHKEAHTVTMKESAIWSVVWFTLALSFGAVLYYYSLHKFPLDPRLAAIPGFNPEAAANQVGLEYLTGFIIEKALAIDNIFVFVVVFSYFAIPPKYQHRVLFFGILGALIFRAGFIAIGSVLMKYHWVVIAAGVFLIATGVKILFAPEKAPDPGKNPVIRLAKKFLPVTDRFHGQKFFIRENHKTYVTPLFLALLFIEFSDIIFAIDSVPAIFAITKEPLIVFTSNIFAILGLRSLYFLLAGVVDKFHKLKSWLNEAFGGKFPIGWSLAIIGGILLLSIIWSLLSSPKPIEAAKQ
ncbi:MAG: TerC/Alx family metal homeostasis membrane protein [Proteobacteria bacterium]|nr:TerC/Alx family metal homeostasis membrane protein [Pseudomonadota bacterium]